MKSIEEVDRDGKLARLYRWSYGVQRKNLPSNLCGYFWKLVVAILLLSITWISYPKGCIFSEYGIDQYGYRELRTVDESLKMKWNFAENSYVFLKRIALGLVGWTLFFAFSYLIGGSLAEFGLIGLLLGVLKFILIALTAVAIATVCLLLGYYANEFHVKVSKSQTFQETKSLLSQRKEGFLNSYCPKIHWRD